MTNRFEESLDRESVLDAETDLQIEEQAETELDHFLDHLDEIDREQRYAERYGFACDDPYQMEQGGFDAPLVFELSNIRSLLANWAYVQSAMSIDDPDGLVLDYTRMMMGFLLFRTAPAAIEIIGLGGGSLAKYCHRYLPESSVTAIEIDPEVIAVGERFCLPLEDDRFEIICADGAEYVRRDPRSCDVMLVDGFDKDGQPARLCSSEFYHDSYSRLNVGGIFVANLCDNPWKYTSILDRIDECFDKVIAVPVEGARNLIVFGFKDERSPLEPGTIRRIASALEQTHPMSFSPLAEGVLEGLHLSLEADPRIDE